MNVIHYYWSWFFSQLYKTLYILELLLSSLFFSNKPRILIWRCSAFLQHVSMSRIKHLFKNSWLHWYGRHSTLDKGHEEGGSAYANAGSSLTSPPGCSRASPPKKTGVCLLYCFVLSPLISLGAVPHHHLALSVKDLT